MNLNQWLDAEKGRATALAEHMDRTPAAVSQWRDNGVPLLLVQKLSDFSNGAMSVEDLLSEALALKQTRSDQKAAA